MKITLKKAISGYTEMDQTKYRVSSMFAYECINWILGPITHIYMYMIWLANFSQENYKKQKW